MPAIDFPNFRFSEKQNALLPVNRISVEILTLIFLLEQEALLQRVDEFPFNRHKKVLMSSYLRVLTAVCQHWRRVALSNPSLWQNIVIQKRFETGQELELAQFTRSFPLSLRVIYNIIGPYHASLDSIDASAGSLFRMLKASDPGRLEVMILPNPLCDESPGLDLFRKPLQSLRALYLHDGGLTDADQFICQIVAPKLQRLELNRFIIPSQLLSQLTHLSITSLPRDYTSEEFLSLLRAMRHLRVLSLNNAFPDPDDIITQGPASIDMPLRRLALRGQDSSAFFNYLLRNLRSPSLLTSAHWQIGSHRPPLHVLLNRVTGLLLVEKMLEPYRMIRDRCSCSIESKVATITRFSTCACPASIGAYWDCQGQAARQLRVFAAPQVPQYFPQPHPQSGNKSWMFGLDVEDVHLYASSVHVKFLEEVDQSERVFFPNLTGLYLWAVRPPSGARTFSFKSNGDDPSWLVELREDLMESGCVFREKKNGKEYQVLLCWADTSEELFTVEWMSTQIERVGMAGSKGPS